MRFSILQKARSIATKVRQRKQPGVALVITLMIMLTLVLISLSLVVQSNTEHLISQNEQDSFKALADAEGVVDFANREIKEWVFANRPLNDLDLILGGALNSSNEDFMVGFKNVLDPTKLRVGLTDENEETTSGIDTLDGEPWEVFRLGVDEDGDGLYDGNIRTIVYARLFDNYDTGSPPAKDNNDEDLRMRLEVRALYPVHLNSSGAEVKTTASRGQSERHLIARFGPTGSVAIRSDASMTIDGSLQICGECGSAHANGQLTLQNGPSVCGNATGTNGYSNTGGSVVGDQGLQPEIYIPIVNPYDPLFVPEPGLFDVTSAFVGLNCPGGPTSIDPGNSKYFAIIRVDNNTTYIYKAYRNWGDAAPLGPSLRWVWRLIGNSDLGNIDSVQLDNCGRLVQCGTGITCSADQNNGVPVTEGVVSANNTFYGWNPDNNLSTQACPVGGEFETIPNAEYTGTVDFSGSNQNDWNVNDFPIVATADTVNVVSTSARSSCGTCLYTGALPGVKNSDSPPDFDGDNIGDFNTANVINVGGSVSTSGNDLTRPFTMLWYSWWVMWILAAP